MRAAHSVRIGNRRGPPAFAPVILWAVWSCGRWTKAGNECDDKRHRECGVSEYDVKPHRIRNLAGDYLASGHDTKGGLALRSLLRRRGLHRRRIDRKRRPRRASTKGGGCRLRRRVRLPPNHITNISWPVPSAPAAPARPRLSHRQSQSTDRLQQRYPQESLRPLNASCPSSCCGGPHRPSDACFRGVPADTRRTWSGLTSSQAVPTATSCHN